MNEEQKKDPKFAKFHGIDREEFQWNPKINEDKCMGCGMCVTSCIRGVYKYDYENKKSKVVNPTNCMVACQTCSNLCQAQAIDFADENDTPRNKAQRIVRDFKLIAKAKKDLEERKESLKL